MVSYEYKGVIVAADLWLMPSIYFICNNQLLVANSIRCPRIAGAIPCIRQYLHPGISQSKQSEPSLASVWTLVLVLNTEITEMDGRFCGVLRCEMVSLVGRAG